MTLFSYCKFFTIELEFRGKRPISELCSLFISIMMMATMTMLNNQIEWMLFSMFLIWRNCFFIHEMSLKLWNHSTASHLWRFVGHWRASHGIDWNRPAQNTIYAIAVFVWQQLKTDIIFWPWKSVIHGRRETIRPVCSDYVFFSSIFVFYLSQIEFIYASFQIQTKGVPFLNR